MDKWQGKMEIPGKKETDKGRPRDLGPGDSVQVTAQGPKQPRRLHELKWQGSGFGEAEAAHICGPLKRSCGNWTCSWIPSREESSWPRKRHWVDQAFNEEITPILSRFSLKIIEKRNVQVHFVRLTLLWYQKQRYYEAQIRLPLMNTGAKILNKMLANIVQQYFKNNKAKLSWVFRECKFDLIFYFIIIF